MRRYRGHYDVIVMSIAINMEEYCPRKLAISYHDVIFNSKPTLWKSIYLSNIKLKHFPRYWPFVRGIHRSPVNSTHKGRWPWVLMFSFICTWTNDKQWRHRWSETPLHSLWRHCNVSLEYPQYRMGFLRHTRIGELGYHWFRQWLRVYSKRCPHLNQCWLMINTPC